MKKLFISADLEGVSGVSSWEETRYGRPGYDAACRQLTREVAAACRAAQELGYTVLVKDGHEDARNIDPTGLPRGVLLHRGWQNEPAAMMCVLMQAMTQRSISAIMPLRAATEARLPTPSSTLSMRG